MAGLSRGREIRIGRARHRDVVRGGTEGVAHAFDSAGPVVAVEARRRNRQTDDGQALERDEVEEGKGVARQQHIADGLLVVEDDKLRVGEPLQHDADAVVNVEEVVAGEGDLTRLDRRSRYGAIRVESIRVDRQQPVGAVPPAYAELPVDVAAVPRGLNNADVGAAIDMHGLDRHALTA
eukprot:scaffold16305_cov124-Isochrysis_galbana.AAC.9